jgi:hypothetical protein
MRRVALILFTALLAVPRAASAQQYLIGASGEMAEGVQGGGAGASPSLSRLRVRLGVDLRVDEFPKDIYEVGLLAEVAPHSSVGIDGRYARMLGERWEANLGGVGILAPASLFGPLAALKYHLPLSPSVAVLIGAEFNVFVIGSDLPGGTIIWQGLLQLGLHANL